MTTLVEVLKGKVPVSVTMYKIPISGHDLLRSLWFNFRLTNSVMLKKYPDTDAALKYFEKNPSYKHIGKNDHGIMSIFEKTFVNEEHESLVIIGDDSEKGFVVEIKRTKDSGFMIYYIGYKNKLGKSFYDWFHEIVFKKDAMSYEEIESNIILYCYQNESTYKFKNTEV